jgi:multidrug efflux pump
MFGSRRVTTYIKNGQEYDVILQSTLEQRRSIEANLDQLAGAHPCRAPWCRCRPW